MKNQVIQSDLADHFQEYMMNHINLYDSLARIIKQMYQGSNPVIVDIGSGPGILLDRIHHQFPQSHIIGIDKSIDMQLIAKNHLENHSIHLIIGDAGYIPLQHDSVDVIISRFSVCYWGNVHRVVQEIQRILRPSGIGIFQMLNRDFSKIRLMMVKMLMKIHRASPDILSYHIDAFNFAYSVEEMTKILNISSFRIIKTFWRRNDWMYTIIFQKPDKSME